MAHTKEQVEALLPFANTARQAELLNEIIKNDGNIRKTATKLLLARSTLRDVIGTVTKYAERRGNLGEMREAGLVPNGFIAETSVQRRLNPETGELEVVSDWTKSKLDKAQQVAAYQEFIKGLASEIVPAKPSKIPSGKFAKDLASAIIFGDAHISMLAHAVETLSEDRDLASATKDIRDAVDYLVDTAPASEEGWFINLGDWLHADGTKGATTKGTSVDVSANHFQVMRASGVTIRYCIDKMLKKFKKVNVINARGNHDNDSAFALNFYIEGVYEKEKRVTVFGNESKFHFLEFGQNLIGINHGDGINHNRLAGVMTRLQSEAWGRTKYRSWYLGHIHHRTLKEHDTGIVMESFNTLAPVDAWHSASGYGANNSATLITLHKEFGEVQRLCPSLDMIRAISK